jgi:hypothetical protein
MQADLVVLDDDPLTDLTHTQTIHRVVKAGRIYAPDALVPRTPEAVVLQGRNAFNAHDLDAFLDAFAPDVQVYDHPDTLRQSGRDALADQYRPVFQDATTLHAQFHYRATYGSTVMTHETIRGRPGGARPASQDVLYRVRDGAIDRVWVVQE